MGSGGVCASSHIGSLASALVPLREFTRVMKKLEVRGYNIKSGAGFAGYLNGSIKSGAEFAGFVGYFNGFAGFFFFFFFFFFLNLGFDSVGLLVGSGGMVAGPAQG